MTPGRPRWWRGCAWRPGSTAKVWPGCYSASERSWSVKRQYPGVKVVRLTWDDQLGPQELKKYHLITKQVRRTRGLRWPGLSPGASGRPPRAQVTGFLSLTALPSGGAHELCPETSRPYPALCPREVKQLLTPRRQTLSPYSRRLKSPGGGASLKLPPLHRFCLSLRTQTC